MAQLSGIRIGTQARALAAALALGAAALSLAPAQANAMRNDNGVRCT